MNPFARRARRPSHSRTPRLTIHQSNEPVSEGLQSAPRLRVGLPLRGTSVPLVNPFARRFKAYASGWDNAICRSPYRRSAKLRDTNHSTCFRYDLLTLLPRNSRTFRRQQRYHNDCSEAQRDGYKSRLTQRYERIFDIHAVHVLKHVWGHNDPKQR